MRDKIIIYTDGGAINNPGPAAIGVVIGDKEYAQYLGETTNNVAEYKAVIFALKKVKQLLGKKKLKDSRIEIRLDSELVAKQLNGKFKILDPELQPLFMEIWNLRFDFPELIFKSIHREENKQADYLVSQLLKKHHHSLFFDC